MANHAIKHTFMGHIIYTNGVGITLSVLSTGNLRTSTTNGQKLDTPLFICSQRNNDLTCPILGVWRAIGASYMKIAILTSGILPVPAVQGGAVETLVDNYLKYNDEVHLHDITVFSVYHPKVRNHHALQSDYNHYRFIDTISLWAKVKKRLLGLINRNTYYHYTIDYYFRQVLKAIAKMEFDCIVIENRPGYALQLPKVAKAKLVYHLHNDFLSDNIPQYKKIYQAASKIITVSEFIKRRVQTCNANDTKTVTVHNGIDLAPFDFQPSLSRQSLGLSEDDFILLFSGRLIPEKGIMELIEAMLMLKDEPHIKLLVMGSSFFANTSTDSPFISKLKEMAAMLSDRIKFTGYVDHDMIPSYLKLSDVAVVPSTWEEPFGLTVAEGMAAGLPIITTNRGGIPEMVTNQNAIVLPFPSDLTGNLVQAIHYLYQNKEESIYMGKVSKTLSKQYDKALYAHNFFKEISTLF
jgi:glycosyltransferase involved in cell wall biosynthesis